MRTKRPHILIVDDVEANLTAMDALLRGLDCEVVCVSTGNDALRQLLKHDFAAVLLDVQMPEMDGFEVARLARMNPRSEGVPIIFVTAMHETEVSQFRGYESGAVDFLFKPIDPHVLVSKVSVFLELHRGRQKLTEEIEAHKRTMAELAAFNYSVSHDLRAPLRPIGGFAQILLEDYGDKMDDEGRDLLGRIFSAAQRMERLIDDLLRLSQVGQSRPVAAPVDLSAIAASIVAQLRTDEPEREVEVSIAEGLTTHGDARLLRIALENLLRNAWKFTRKTTSPRIEVGGRSGADGLAFFVRDNGVGFDAGGTAKLFGAFQRLHSADEFEGTGIGLAIVRRVVHHHGGKAWGEGQLNRGATFWFTVGQPSSLSARRGSPAGLSGEEAKGPASTSD